jgi:hypothetical protein
MPYLNKHTIPTPYSSNFPPIAGVEMQQPKEQSLIPDNNASAF